MATPIPQTSSRAMAVRERPQTPPRPNAESYDRISTAFSPTKTITLTPQTSSRATGFHERPQTPPRSNPESHNRTSTSFPFLQLPFELRDMVYKSFLIKPEAIALHPHCQLAGSKHPDPSFSLLRVNRLINQEATEVILRKSFCVDYVSLRKDVPGILYRGDVRTWEAFFGAWILRARSLIIIVEARQMGPRSAIYGTTSQNWHASEARFPIADILRSNYGLRKIVVRIENSASIPSELNPPMPGLNTANNTVLTRASCHLVQSLFVLRGITYFKLICMPYMLPHLLGHHKYANEALRPMMGLGDGFWHELIRGTRPGALSSLLVCTLALPKALKDQKRKERPIPQLRTPWRDMTAEDSIIGEYPFELDEMTEDHPLSAGANLERMRAVLQRLRALPV